MPRAVLLFLVIAVVSCKKQEVEVYDVAKQEAQAPSALPAGHPPVPEQAQSRPVSEPGRESLRWTVPRGWLVRPGSGMRYATFMIPGKSGKAELSIVVLPADAGGTLPNINRWRGQIGLPPLSETELPEASSHVKSMAGTLLVVDFESLGTQGAGAPKSRLLAAILSHKGKTWFFKTSGETGVVGGAKPSVMKFLQSLH